MPDNAAVTADSSTRGRQLTSYIAGGRKREFPPNIIDAAKRALVDFAGVAIGAADQPVVRAVRRVADEWKAAGNAQIFLGGKTTPAVAVLVNGTMVHAMDYDDTHPGGTGHPSGPCWSTALALRHGEPDLRCSLAQLGGRGSGSNSGARLGLGPEGNLWLDGSGFRRRLAWRGTGLWEPGLHTPMGSEAQETRNRCC